MHHSLSTESNPIDADLERVLPGVHRWHQANQSALTVINTKVDELVNEFRNGLQQLQEHNTATRVDSDQRIGAAFLRIAQDLLAGAEIEDDTKASHSSVEEGP